MTNELETIREALNALASTDSGNPRDPTHALVTLAREALDRLAANTLDLGAVPEGWRIEVCCVALTRTVSGKKRWVDGEGLNPSAAFAAAIERTKQS